MIFKKICFVVAMSTEARPLIDALGLTEDSEFGGLLPMKGFIGEYKGIQLSLVINGKDKDTGLDLIGTQAATLATQFAVEKYAPQLIINAGTAGAFGENGAMIGDVYLSRDHIVFHDRRVPIAGWDKQSIGYFSVWDVAPLLPLGFKWGVVTTGNSLDMPLHDEENIRKIGGEIKEMEAAAVAWVAGLHGIPMFCVKSVTDLMDSGIPTHEEFKMNLQVATGNLRDGVLKIIGFFAN
jgi:5'-methylthioadenosine nucleosidase